MKPPQIPRTLPRTRTHAQYALHHIKVPSVCSYRVTTSFVVPVWKTFGVFALVKETLEEWGVLIPGALYPAVRRMRRKLREWYPSRTCNDGGG